MKNRIETELLRLPGVLRFVVFAFVLLTAAGVYGAEKPTTPQQTCVTAECHGDYAEKTHIHAPVELGDCKACHKEADPAQHTFEFIRKGRDLCEFCHLDQAAKKHVHEPLEKGQCIDCHDPHSSEAAGLLTTDSMGQLCSQCHDTTKGMKFLHGPVAVGQCTMCHDSHSADNEGLLRADATELCFSCHVTTKEEISEYEYIHEPAMNDCVGCHDAHGAQNAKMLKGDAPGLCYSCHEDIKNTAENSNVKHSAVTEGESCTYCHTPHASTVQYGLKDVPGKLCLSCHNEAIQVNEDKIIPSFAKAIEDKKSLHGPVAQQDCKGCHVAHGSEHFRLLEKEYPPQFYAPFKKDNYALCFSCHPESLVLTKSTTKLTDFRNGDLNLHYVHVNKSRRGRTCRSCHETHASNLPKHIRSSVPYGAWDLPIGYKKTETGGGCKPGCHVPYDYDRTSPVSYSK